MGGQCDVGLGWGLRQGGLMGSQSTQERGQLKVLRFKGNAAGTHFKPLIRVLEKKSNLLRTH